ncbi:MAG: ABC transporter permease [Gammaproteobacteria bacterium]|nr:ABC transporter permease [Gammaproteobacteria bacterium]
MKVLLRQALLRELVRGKWSLAAALFGVSVAVASVTAVHLLNARVDQNLEALQPFELLGTIARREDGANIALADYAGLQNRLAEGQLPGVDSLVPLIEGRAGENFRNFRIFGIDWVATIRMRANVGVAAEADWTRLMTEKSVLAPEGLADNTRADIEAQGLSVIGTHSGSDERLLIADIATASELLGQDEISALALVPVPERRGLLDLLDQVFVGLGAAYRSSIDQHLLGAGYVISTPDEELPVRRFAKSIMFNLGVLSVLCLLVAAFIAYQSAAGMALRRAPTLHRLRGLGVATRDISGYVHREAGALGVLACLVGLPLGFGLATFVIEFGGMGSLDRSLFDGWLVIKAALVGIGVSVLGTSLAQPRTQAKRLRPLLQAGFACLALGALLISLFLGLAGAFLLLGAVFALFAQVAWMQLNWISRHGFAGLRIRLITRQIVRGAAALGLRLFPVVSAFILALSVALSMQLMVASLKLDFDEFLEMRLDGELSLDADAGALSQILVDAVEALSGVRSTRVSHTATARVGTLGTEVRLIDYTAQELARYGAPIDTPLDAVLINSQLVSPREAGTVRVTGDKGQALLPVAHVFNDFGAAGPRLVMSRAVADRYFEGTRIDAVRIHVEPGSETAVRSRIQTEFGLQAEATAELRERAMHALEDTFWVSDALSMVALLVAIFGVFSGFNQLHLTRLRELRLLRAVGMSRRRLLALLTGQSALLAALVLPCSLVLALIMNWTLCQRVTPLAFGFSIRPHMDGWLMALFSSIGLLVVVTAALVPWRMTREASHVATTDERI